MDNCRAIDCEDCDGTLMEPNDGETVYEHPLMLHDADALQEYVPARRLLKVIEDDDDDWSTPLKVTLHESPDWRPDSVKVTDKHPPNVIEIELVVTVPDEGEGLTVHVEPIATLGTDQLIPISDAVMEMLSVVDWKFVGPKVTLQDVPDGSPDSVNVTSMRLHVTATVLLVAWILISPPVSTYAT